MNGTSAVSPNVCQWCGGTHATLCPTVKAIEYFENGTMKRVEFKTFGDYGQPIALGGQHYTPPGSLEVRAYAGLPEHLQSKTVSR